MNNVNHHHKKGFFSTVQLLFAGKDSQGLRYGTTGTPEKDFAEWKAKRDPAQAPVPGELLDRPLAEMCENSRLLDLIRDFIIFDAGQKKVPRPHPYAGAKAAQERSRQRRRRTAQADEALAGARDFIGFTGTPLLRRDRQTTREIFGSYIHTYKFHEGVADKVILDLKHEARDVPQRITSQKGIDAWFAKTTKGLNPFQQASLRRRWATYAAAEDEGPGAGNATAVCRTRKPLSVGAAIFAVGCLSGRETQREAGPQTDHPDGAPWQRSG